MCHRFSGKKLRDIGKRFGISESSVTQASRRMKIKAEKKNSVKRNIKSIGKKSICQMCRSDPFVFTSGALAT
jgi:transposase